MSEEETNGIGQRLREVRGKMSQTEFAEILGVHMNSIVRYESGKSTPDAATISKLFEKLQVDPTWLITGQRKPIEGLSDNESSLLKIYRSLGQQKSSTKTLGQRLREVRGGMSQIEFAERTGTTQATISRYEAGSLVPDGIFLIKLTELFNTNPAWILLGKESGYEPIIAPEEENPTKSAIRTLVSVIATLEREKKG